MVKDLSLYMLLQLGIMKYVGKINREFSSLEVGF